MKKFAKVLLALVFAFMVVVPSVNAEGVSKSKTATELDENNTSKVTLSLPSDEERLVSDVVFVIDSSSCGGAAWAKATNMMETLSKQVAEKNGALKVGAVIFRGVAFDYELTLTDSDSISTVMNAIIAKGKETEAYVSQAQYKNTLKGSNLHSGLIEADRMLAADKEVDNSRKYVIVISDGITYTWDQDGVQVGEYYTNNDSLGFNPITGMYPSNSAYEVSKHTLDWAPENNDWAKYFSENEEALIDIITNKALPYDRSKVSDTVYSLPSDAVNTVDAALYQSYKAYNTLASKYHAYAITLSNSQYGKHFMNFLNGGKSDDALFEEIKYDIYYVVSAGTQVEDVMGYDETYNFDFVQDSKEITVTVGDEVFEAVETAEKEYSFDKTETGYNYVVNYFAEGDTDVDGTVVEHDYFVWTINTDVSNFTRVSLSYKVQLVTSPSEEGTYTLETNKVATITPVDSFGVRGETEEFEVPTVTLELVAGIGGDEEEFPIVQTGDQANSLLMAVMLIVTSLMGYAVSRKELN